MSIHAISWASKLDLPPRDKFVLIALCDHYNEDEKAAWMKQSTLAGWTCYGRDTINAALHDLEHKHGILRSETRRYADGRNAPKVYRLTRVGQADPAPTSVGESDTARVGDADPDSVGEADNKNRQHRSVNIEPTPPPTPPRQEAEVGVEQANRTPPRNSDKVQVLRQRYKTTWEALGQLSSDRGWKPNQFKAVAVTMLDLARWHGEQQATAALRDVLVQGDQIRNPVKWVEKALTDDRPREGPKKTKRLNLLEGTGVES